MKKKITLTNINKSYQDGLKKKKIIHSLSLDIFKEEVFGFIGPNGAGKSTVINLLMGFIKADSGQILLDGMSPEEPSSRSNIGYLPEDPRFYDHLTASELLSFGGRSSGMSKSEVKNAIDPVLERLDLLHVKKNRFTPIQKV